MKQNKTRRRRHGNNPVVLRVSRRFFLACAIRVPTTGNATEPALCGRRRRASGAEEVQLGHRCASRLFPALEILWTLCLPSKTTIYALTLRWSSVPCLLFPLPSCFVHLLGEMPVVLGCADLASPPDSWVAAGEEFKREFDNHSSFRLATASLSACLFSVVPFHFPAFYLPNSWWSVASVVSTLIVNLDVSWSVGRLFDRRKQADRSRAGMGPLPLQRKKPVRATNQRKCPS